MDKVDRDHFADAYRLLAEVLQRERPSDSVEGHIPFILGDITRRVFVGTQFDPPDEILERTAEILRSGNEKQRKSMAQRLLDHANYLDQLSDREELDST